jgi:hypothetical protein
MTAANPWTNNGDGTMTVKDGGGDIVSKMSFTNVFVHVEYWSPKFDYPRHTEFRQRGNSGAFLKASYELVIVDTFGLTVGTRSGDRLLRRHQLRLPTARLRL